MKIALILLIFFITSCSTTNRTISSSDVNLSNEFSTVIRGQQIDRQIKYLNSKPTVFKYPKLSALKKEKENLTKADTKSHFLDVNMENSVQNIQTPWRESHDIINLKEEYFLDENGNYKDYVMYYDKTESKDYYIQINNLFKSLLVKKYKKNSKVFKTRSTPIKAQLLCDKLFKLKTNPFKYKSFKNKEVFIHNPNYSLLKLKIKLPNENTTCKLNWNVSGVNYNLTLKDETHHLKSENKYKNNFEVCTLPDTEKIKSSKIKLFFTNKYNNMGCPFKIDSYNILDNKIDGLKAKAEALLGQEVPKQMLENFDADYPLDFSNAPKIKGIYISYLVWRHDFFGALMERLIRHHASNGVPIKIFISKVISLDKDKKMLTQLNADYPNVTIKLYQYRGKQNIGIKSKLSFLHRTNHIKSFLVNFADPSKKDVAIFGGRNIHDGFIFDITPDLSKHPHLVQYGKDESKAIWTDFEIEIHNNDFNQSLIRHFHSFWNYDQKDYIFRPNYLHKVINKEPSKDLLDQAQDNGIVRHFISTPFSDNFQLEKLYVDLINSAEKSINISTPYFNLTPKISEAFSNAVKKGVKIEVLTRLNLDGDIASKLLADVNKGQINKFKNVAELNEYILPKNASDILHSKIIVVDNELLALGSVNFNQRSFYHDLENLAFIWSPKIGEQINLVLEDYKKTSKPITKKQKIKWLNKIIIRGFKEEL